MGEESPTPAPSGRPKVAIAAIVVVVIVIIGGLAYYLMTQGGEEESVLVFYASTNVLSLDPQDSYDTMSFIPIHNIYDTLIDFPGDEIDSYVGSLATDWDVSPNGLFYNFTLREDVEFSNGNNFNASDVKFSVERSLAIENTGISETGVGWILTQDLDENSVTIIDEYHVQFQLTHSYAGFLATIAQQFPLGILDEEYTTDHYSDDDPLAHEFMKDHPMGTGPYMMESWTPSIETVLVKNDRYWKGWDGNHVDKVIIKEVAEANTRVQALISGDAHIAEIPYTNIPDVEDEAGVVVDPVSTFQLEMIAMCVNTTRVDHEFMQNAQVRQAFAWAFDYANTSSQYYYGYMDPAQGAIPNGMPYETESQPYRAFNFSLGRASELLNVSGYTLNAQDERFDGEPLDLYVDEGDTERIGTAQLYKTNLNRLGIAVEIHQVTSAVLEDVRPTRDWDMYMTGWVIDYLDPDDYVFPIGASYDVGGDYFLTGIVNTDVDNATLAAAETNDADARIENYTAVWQELNEDPNMIFAGQTRYVAFYRDNVQGFMFNPVTWYNFYFYWLE